MKQLLYFAGLLLLFAGMSFAQNLTAEELEKHLANPEKIFFLDVRSVEEVEKLGSVPGYVNIPLPELEKRLSEIPKEKLVITICERGRRAGTAAELLTKNGYKIAGSCGLIEYREKGKKLVFPESSKKG